MCQKGHEIEAGVQLHRFINTPLILESSDEHIKFLAKKIVL